MAASRENAAVTITAYKDGPYLVRGPFQMLDQEGNEIALARPTIALCRCGKSRIRPLCDGTHRTIGFRAPGRAEGGVAHATAGRSTSEPTRLLAAIQRAEECIARSLTQPCLESAHAAMSLAEPLLSAARRLMEWIAVGEETGRARTLRVEHEAPTGLTASRSLIDEAATMAQRLPVGADRRLVQVRSLLTDAARAVSAVSA